MTLSALQHLIRSAQALSENSQIIILGSSSLLATFPQLGEPDQVLSTTFDADLYVAPFENLTALMLEESLGEGHAFHRIHGYHADVMREEILQTFPHGWFDRKVPVPGTTAHALEPHDLAAVKILVHRKKDLALVRCLWALGLLDATTIRARLDLLPVPIEMQPRLHARWKTMTMD